MPQTMIEAEIEGYAVALATRNGWLVRKVQWIGRRGAPDRLFAKDGRVVLVEMKRPKKDLDPLQRREVRRLRAAGIEVCRVNTMEEARALFSRP